MVTISNPTQRQRTLTQKQGLLYLYLSTVPLMEHCRREV
jgi:hypothetical protein